MIPLKLLHIFYRPYVNSRSFENGNCVRLARMIENGSSQVHSGSYAVHIVIQNIKTIYTHLKPNYKFS